MSNEITTTTTIINSIDIEQFYNINADIYNGCFIEAITHIKELLTKPSKENIFNWFTSIGDCPRSKSIIGLLKDMFIKASWQSDTEPEYQKFFNTTNKNIIDLEELYYIWLVYNENYHYNMYQTHEMIKTEG